MSLRSVLRRNPVVPGICGVLVLTLMLLACGDEDGGVTLLENVEIMGRDEAFQQREVELRAEYEACESEAGKIPCLAGFLERQEAQLDACLKVFTEDDFQDLCTAKLELIAAEKGWSIPGSERKRPLLEDPGALTYHSDCVRDVDAFQCFTRFLLLEEYKFDICEDFFGGDDCATVIAEVLAGSAAELALPEDDKN